MTMKSAIALGALVACLSLSQQARADLIISVNGTPETTDPTNTTANFTGTVGGFNINNITATGVTAFGTSGTLLDVGSLNVSTAGTGSLTLLITETNLTGPAALNLFSEFSATLSNISVTRSIFFDSTNAGLETTLLGSTTTGNATFSSNLATTGLFSLVEEIDLTAIGAGARLSSDDSVSAVPEPSTWAMMILGFVGLGFMGYRRSQKSQMLSIV